MTQIIFDIEHCFVDGRSGPIELGVTRLDDLARVHAPTFDLRAHEGSSGSPFLAYGNYGEDDGRLDLFDMYRTGHVTAVFIDLRGDYILQRCLEVPEQDPIELACGPFTVRMRDKPVEHWTTLVDSVASGAIEPGRPTKLSSDPRGDLRTLNVDWELHGGRRLHLSFHPRMIATPMTHACQVRFEYCIERVRLFSAQP